MDILVVEDDPIHRKLVESVLRMAGHSVTGVRAPGEALKLLQSSEPKVLVVDLQLPMMDGLQLVRTLRRNPRTKELWIAAMTAHRERWSQQEAFQAGCNLYFGKPLDTRAFPSILVAGVPTGDIPKTRQRVAHPARAGRIRVLLADDHPVIRKSLVELLGACSDMEVLSTASDGEEAIALSRELLPDVVIMDLNMPKLGGVDATRLITTEIPEIRVIGLSTHADGKAGAAMRKAGAVAYLCKDCPPVKLIATIRACTR